MQRGTEPAAMIGRGSIPGLVTGQVMIILLHLTRTGYCGRAKWGAIIILLKYGVWSTDPA